MRAMKDSGIEWIGEIPQEWKLTRIGYLFKTIGSGTTPPSSDSRYYDGDYNWLQTGDLNDGIISTTEKTITDQAIEKHSIFRQYSIGSLVVAMYGATIGKLGILSIPCYTNQACCVLTEPITAVTKYVYYWLLCNRQNLITFSLGGGQPNINQNTIRGFKICLPSKAEQESIVSFLEKKCAEIDALIAAKEKTNALLKERRQSIIYEAVTKGLDPTAPMKDSGVEWIGEIPEGWQVAPLKYFASIRSGFTLGKKYDSELELREYPYLRVANVQGEYTDLENVTTILMPVTEAEQYKLKAGELLMTEGGDRDKLGRGSIWQGEIPDCLHQNHVFALSADERLSIEYLDYLTASDVGRNYFDYTAVKTTNLASTNATTILNFKIPIPSINEQLNIVEYLKEKCQTIDDILWINNAAIQKLKEYRQSLIYEAVTGKKEV